jgi:hypothetical protein
VGCRDDAAFSVSFLVLLFGGGYLLYRAGQPTAAARTGIATRVSRDGGAERPRTWTAPDATPPEMDDAMKVLVAWASKHGATARSVAPSAAPLRERRIRVVMCPIENADMVREPAPT